MDYGDKTLDTHMGEGDWTVGWLEDDIAWHILSPLFPIPKMSTNFMWGEGTVPSTMIVVFCSRHARHTDRPAAAAAIHGCRLLMLARDS